MVCLHIDEKTGIQIESFSYWETSFGYVCRLPRFISGSFDLLPKRYAMPW